jgi:hypothetical protein
VVADEVVGKGTIAFLVLDAGWAGPVGFAVGWSLLSAAGATAWVSSCVLIALASTLLRQVWPLVATGGSPACVVRRSLCWRG